MNDCDCIECKTQCGCFEYRCAHNDHDLVEKKIQDICANIKNPYLLEKELRALVHLVIRQYETKDRP